MTNINNTSRVINKNSKNGYREVKKLQDKIITLQDLIISKEKEINLVKKESEQRYLKLTDECFKKGNKIFDLENKILAINALMARQ